MITKLYLYKNNLKNTTNTKLSSFLPAKWLGNGKFVHVQEVSRSTNGWARQNKEPSHFDTNRTADYTN
jgi:hypothetical protein